jgi:hypothetical protein
VLHIVATASGIAVYATMNTTPTEVHAVFRGKNTFGGFKMHVEISLWVIITITSEEYSARKASPVIRRIGELMAWASSMWSNGSLYKEGNSRYAVKLISYIVGQRIVPSFVKNHFPFMQPKAAFPSSTHYCSRETAVSAASGLP